MTGSTDHSGKVALVTGGNRGIGLETARQLAELGFTVLIGVRDLAKGEAAAKRLGGKVEAIALDVAASEAAARAAAEVERRFGRLDILVNNAAIHYDPSARALKPDWTVIREAFETMSSAPGASLPPSRRCSVPPAMAGWSTSRRKAARSLRWAPAPRPIRPARRRSTR